MTPIYFAAATVPLIREICEADGNRTGDDLAQEMIGNIAKDSLDSCTTGSASGYGGAFGVLDALIDVDDEIDRAAVTRMQAVVDRWNIKAAAEGRADA